MRTLLSILSLHFFLKPVVNFLGDGYFQAAVKGFGTDGLLQAFHVGADVGAAAIHLAAEVQVYVSLGGTDHTDHLALTYLNDDKPALRWMDDTWMAYGTPWSGKNDLSSPMGAALGGIAFLKRGEQNAIRRFSPDQALPWFMSQSLWRLSGAEAMDRQLRLADRLLRQVPIWELTCRNDDEAAMVSYRAMTNPTKQ